MVANLKNILSEKRSVILERWVDHILDTYPAETANFLREKKNRFANPVAHSVSEGVEGIFEDLLQGIDKDRVSVFLDNIIRIRAIQEFTPSQAISFVFFLKKIMRDELAREIRENNLSDELALIENHIDLLGLLAFDIFMGCREKLYDIKANEMKHMTFRLLQKANLIYEKPEEEPDVSDSNFVNLNEKR
ncbi:MAG: hypothetical protein CVV37_07340 [Nitrospira bacterium HGW-Nitrospira-1]|nr:MAG: hypothetical protein CVV37_07340 [Nitrospira bacterium HGW-Nitrospira-1]